MGYEKIPAELRQLPQWVVAGQDKVPICARTGWKASPADPSGWGTFEEAVAAGYPHVGFVFTPSDAYTCVDLDDPHTIKVNGKQIPNPNPQEVQDRIARHTKVLNLFPSYSELSQSKRGAHIIVKGKVPANVQREKVEVYSVNHYVILTGDVLNDAPIQDCQSTLETMVADMTSTNGAIPLLEEPPAISDTDLLQMAFQASNAEKFGRLWKGDCSGYPSQSEADNALLALLCFYTRSNAQVRRVFRMSSLGQREKATKNDYYIDLALGKIRGRQEAETLPMVDISALLAKYDPPPIVPDPPHLLNGHINGHASTIEIELTPEPLPRCPSFPPGLIGEMADYIYSSAIRPIPEVGLTMALAMGSGFLGRQFQISNTGFNQYIVLVGQSGVGKEGGVDGVESLIGAVRERIPQVDEFLGPAAFASGQAFISTLDRTNNFFSIFGEIGITLRQICDKRASSHEVQFKKVLLDLYGKSGSHKHLRPTVYSDKQKNTGLIKAPSVSFWGDTTPDIFYNSLEAEHVAQGIIPRLLIVDYKGNRPPENPNAFQKVPESLKLALTTAFQTVLAMKFNDQFAPVGMDAAGKKLLGKFNKYADEKINSNDNDSTRQLWNRAHLKALKLAGLIATGCNIHGPIVTGEIATWALEMISQEVESMCKKFTSGEMGTGDHQCEADIRRAVEKYPAMTAKQRAAYNVPENLRELPKAIPYVFLKKYCSMRSAFKNHPRGAVTAMDVALKDILKAGILQLIPAPEVKKMTGTDSALYYRGEAWQD